MFKKFERDGYCRKSDEVLPLDAPYREQLYEAGIDSIVQLQEVEDIAELRGFTEQMAYRVDKWLAKYQETVKLKAAKNEAQSESDSAKK